jgi:hypothetical protein
MSTPTPRTDDAQWGHGKVTTDFARTLERELAAASQAYKCAMAIHGTVMEERDRVAAELAAERARLDSGQILLTVAGERVWACGVDLRAAIDAAMKEDAK